MHVRGKVVTKRLPSMPSTMMELNKVTHELYGLEAHVQLKFHIVDEDKDSRARTRTIDAGASPTATGRRK
jgi:hypothetical protein